MLKTWSFFLVLSLPAFATNGSNLIGLSARSVGMGGTGVAHYQGVMESIHKNPSLLVKHKGVGTLGAEFSNTLLGLNVTGLTTAGEVESKGKSRYIPDLAADYKIQENMAVGLGVLPYAGAKFDFSGVTQLVGLKTDHTVVKIQPTFAFSPVQNLNFGLSPIIGYGELALNSAVTGTQSDRPPHGGVGFAGQVGASYQLDRFTFGASYTSPLKIKYKEVTNLDLFGPNAANAAFAAADDIEIQQPGEIALGVAMTLGTDWAFSVDYRSMGWSNADTYRELGWKSQNVIAFGGQYRMDKLALRLGFNYAKSPLDDIAGETGSTTVSLQGHTLYQASISRLDTNGFPPLATTHFTLGTGYEFSADWGADFAFLYAPKVAVTRAGTLGATAYSYRATMSQWAVTLGVRHAI